MSIVNIIRIGLAILCLALLYLFPGCETYRLQKLNPHATGAQRAQAALIDAQTGIKFTAGPAITAWLIIEKDPAKQAEDAAWVYAAATALNSAATGKILTRTELQNIIKSFTNDNDPRHLQLAQLLSAEYGKVIELFKVTETSPAKFLAELAVIAQNSAMPFLSARP